MPLPLYGTARVVRTNAADNSRRVIRLCNPGTPPVALEDVALVRSPDDLWPAVESGFSNAWLIGEGWAQALPTALQTVYCVSGRYDYLAVGDLIGVEATQGRFRVHYRQSSRHNSFLVTDRCNHYCLMCSQPPKDVDDRWILREIRACLPLIDRTTLSLGFTGGEPLLEWRDFVDVLERCRYHLPDTAIHVLSNGRAFADHRVVAAWTGIKHPNLTVGIPIYSAVDNVHDYVVQAAGAFDETVLGILKLKDRGGRVEVRVVLHAITAPRLVETARWIARNLPFVDHVALMGLENTGFAIANDALLWIDPVDYERELAESVITLAAAGVRVSIYNLPLCVVPASVRSFAARSISDWKNGYAAECDRCDEKTNCGGLFTSGRPKRSRGIRAISHPQHPPVAEHATDEPARLP